MYANAVTADGLGNAYITGEYYGNPYFNSTQLDTGINSVYLIKYDTTGQIRWAKRGCIEYAGISVSSGNKDTGGCYLQIALAKFGGEAIWGKDTFNVDIKNGIDEVIIKVDENGNLKCNSPFSEGDEDDGSGLATDATGKQVYVAGDVWKTCIFGKDTLNGGSKDIPFMARWQPCVPKDTVVNPPILPIDTIHCGAVYVPNAFSPNGDGHNDMEHVYGNCIESMDFTVFDRWGNKVFESENVKLGWDGTYKGQAMNTGTFVYYMHAAMLDGTIVNKHGNITLVR